MDLKKAIKSVNILNIDVDESTSSKETFLLKEEEHSYIVSDADDEILILIEFVHCVDLHNIIFTALPIEDNESSPPKEIHLYKTKNIDVNFDDMSSLSADKVIECKSKKLSKGHKVSLHKHKKLAFRQMKYLIIYIKANQNESEKTHLHRLQIKGIYHGKLSENAQQQITQQAIKTFDESKYIQRIDELFKKQQSKLNDEDFYDVACKQYGGNIAHFLNDYHRFIKNMNSNRLYLRQRNAVCSKTNCPFMKRQNRYKRNENGDEKSMIRQRLQQIHILCHQYDESEKIKNDQNYKQQIIKMKKMEYKDDDEKAPHSKFVTDIKASSTSLNNGKYLKYSLGFKFFYHPFYKNNDEYVLGKEYHYEAVPNIYRQGFQSLFKDLYVSPKYKDLKEELAGKYLPVQQFYNAMKKAIKNINLIEGRKLRANNQYEERYGVKAGSPISVDHMLCIMLYTNYNNLQNKFSKTFRKLSKNESDKELKERHSAFAHLSRFLTEAVKCYGNESKITVYHGVNALTIFDDCSVNFSGPTSTTTSWEVAIYFATNSGTVITMQSIQDHVNSHHFDCALWSDFPWEEEELFIGMKASMNVINVHDIHNNVEYDKWTKVIRVFTCALIGKGFLDNPITAFVEESINLLIESVTNKSVKVIPEYIVDTFNYIRRNVKKLSIGMHMLLNDFYWKHKDSSVVFYGGKKFKYVYFDQNNNIKWSFIKLLFPNMSRFEIMNSIPSTEGVARFSVSNTILLTNDLLNEVFDFLKETHIKEVRICSPINDIRSMLELRARFRAKYDKIGYGMVIMVDVLSNPRYMNKCNMFQIEIKSNNI